MFCACCSVVKASLMISVSYRTFAPVASTVITTYKYNNRCCVSKRSICDLFVVAGGPHSGPVNYSHIIVVPDGPHTGYLGSHR